MSPESACALQGSSPAVPYSAKFRLWLVSGVSQNGHRTDGPYKVQPSVREICYAMASMIALKVPLDRIAFDVRPIL